MTASVVDAPQTAPDGDRAVRTVVVELQGGLDGPLTLLTMLRGRRYDVVDLRAEIGTESSRLTVSVLLPAARTDVLLERLRRVPVVLDARPA